MPSYWWECESCSKSMTFPKITNSKGIVHFIWDVLTTSDWDQNYLKQKCMHCGENSARIAYDFPSAKKITLRVVHIVGLAPSEKNYLPMMWETYPKHNTEDRWFDFKYVIGRSIFGLSKPAVFNKEELHKVIELYRLKTGQANFLI